MNKIIEQIESELTGDAERDLRILEKWEKKYQGIPGAESLLNEIRHLIFSHTVSKDMKIPQRVFDEMVNSAGDDFAEARSLIEKRQYDEALEKLAGLTELIKVYPLSEDAVWTDFNSYLDALIYQDYFEDEIAGREVCRHPLHPSRILFTYGSLLVELERADEALEPLEMILSFDPVCPKYLFELGDAYKRAGHIQDAYESALWALGCVSDNEELARCYRDLAYCMVESGAYEDAVMLNMLSQRFHYTNHAKIELAWILKKTGISVLGITEEKINQRCEELEIPVGLNKTVLNNLKFLKMIQSGDIGQ